MKIKHFIRSKVVSLVIWGPIGILALVGQLLFPDWVVLTSGVTLLQLVAYLALIMVGSELISLAVYGLLKRQHKPPVEGVMLGNLLRLVAVFGVIIIIAYGFGQLSAFGQFFTLFGGMLLGWSLQAPVSGFAAWALVSLKRPFRPGDRIQFPNLGLVGDVKDIGLMYTMLDQVGGSIGSEEAVGRYILVPNAMLFSQVAINYTVVQEAAYMLDEVVIRITYDSDWEAAEKILLESAYGATQDVIDATGAKPYIRSDPYDYGVYLRLRYQTRATDRAETSYEITKRIFNAIQHTPSIDLAIPYVYSFRAGAGQKDDQVRSRQDTDVQAVQQIPIAQINPPDMVADAHDVEALAQSIAARGLLQPIIVARRPSDGTYDVLAGHLRFMACKSLGWKTIPAMVKSAAAPATSG
jgi:small-conductance mechanosensitive channel